MTIAESPKSLSICRSSEAISVRILSSVQTQAAWKSVTKSKDMLRWRLLKAPVQTKVYDEFPFSLRAKRADQVTFIVKFSDLNGKITVI